MRIDLNNSFPLGEDGSRKPLPKQKQFMQMALDPKGPDYVLFCSGVGAGKTLVGCITVLTWAVMYPGDYLIARQFGPELSITTLKTFLEICPKELIHEYRVADRIVKIRAVGGKLSTIMFRQAEEPDKWRSLNLSGAYLDESSQTTQKTFEILQGRMRGKGLRKIIMTTNPNGHDWQYNLFVRKDGMTEEGKKKFALIRAYSTENVHLPDGYVQSMMSTWSEDKIRREIYGDFDSFAGQVYPEFRREVHVIKPFRIPDDWVRIVGIDHGLRNPACWLWGAVDYDENIYIYREFYQKEWLIEEICKGYKRPGVEESPGVVKLNAKERITAAYIDPSTAQRRGQTGFSDYDHYLEHLPEGFPLVYGNNDVKAGIERVKQFLKVDELTGKPRLMIFEDCVNLIDEMAQYRYPELLSSEHGRKPEDEIPIKANDHANDACRYLLMSRPDPTPRPDERYKNVKAGTSEYNVLQDILSLKKPKVTDQFGF